LRDCVTARAALNAIVSLIEVVMRTWVLGVIVVVLACGCRSVPGDAALRGDHPEQAAELYRRGAEQGGASAALRLGLLLDEGRVSASKYGHAGEWFKRGCDSGDLPSCHNVGVAYEYGKNGLPKDHSEARSFYLRAAAAGYVQSQYNLASLYSNGYITPPDDVEGLKWMLLAQASAERCKQQELCQWILRDPPGHRHRLESRLSSMRQDEAAALAGQWHAKK
jgi:hypothetical protein